MYKNRSYNFYFIDKNNYFAKDLGLGSGTFLKCQTNTHTVLRNG